MVYERLVKHCTKCLRLDHELKECLMARAEAKAEKAAQEATDGRAGSIQLKMGNQVEDHIMNLPTIIRNTRRVNREMGRSTSLQQIVKTASYEGLLKSAESIYSRDIPSTKPMSGKKEAHPDNPLKLEKEKYMIMKELHDRSRALQLSKATRSTVSKLLSGSSKENPRQQRNWVKCFKEQPGNFSQGNSPATHSNSNPTRSSK